LHLAAGKRAGLAVVTAWLKVYAAATGVASEDGDLPLHLAAGDAELKVSGVSSIQSPENCFWFFIFFDLFTWHFFKECSAIYWSGVSVAGTIGPGVGG
jgi:hypothetical protein